jgi:adenine specific DNA methylase Mod
LTKDKHEAFETFEFDLPPIRGFPELRWAGKRPFKATQYLPAQKRESYGDATEGWWHRIYWGDNLQVMSHLLRGFRGKVDLIYIDPPFDTGVNYGKSIKIKGGHGVEPDRSSFEEKQYKDIWVNDEFAQFIFERLILCKELLAETGSIVVHSNPHSAHMVRSLCDEVFSPDNFRNEVVWVRTTAGKPSHNVLPTNTDRLLWYSKGSDYKFSAPSGLYQKKIRLVSTKMTTMDEGITIRNHS